MTEETMVEEQKKQEEKVEEHKPKDKPKEKFNFKKWLKGSNKREYVENISFLIITISAIMIAGGIALGSFVQETVYASIAGALFLMLGIAVYIISQFTGE